MQAMESVTFSDDSQDSLYSQSMSERVHRAFRRLDFDVVAAASSVYPNPPKMEALVKSTAHILRDLNHVSTERPREDFTADDFQRNEDSAAQRLREERVASDASARSLTTVSASGLAQLTHHYASPHPESRPVVSISMPALKQCRTAIPPPTPFRDAVSSLHDLANPDQEPLDLTKKKKNSEAPVSVTSDSSNGVLTIPVKKENSESPCVPGSQPPSSPSDEPSELVVQPEMIKQECSDSFFTSTHNQTSGEDTLERAVAILGELKPSTMGMFVCVNDRYTRTVCNCFTASNASSDTTLTCHCNDSKLRSLVTESTCQEDAGDIVASHADNQFNKTYSIHKAQDFCDEKRIVEGCEVFDPHQGNPQTMYGSIFSEDASELPSFQMSRRVSRDSRSTRMDKKECGKYKQLVQSPSAGSWDIDATSYSPEAKGTEDLNLNEEEMDVSLKYPGQASTTARNSSRECWSVDELSPSKPLTLKLSRRQESSNVPIDMRSEDSDCLNSTEPDVLSQPSKSGCTETSSPVDKVAIGDTLSFIVRTSESDINRSLAFSCVSQPTTPEYVFGNSFVSRPHTPKEMNSSTPISSAQPGETVTCRFGPSFKHNNSLRRQIFKKAQTSISHDANSVLNLGFTQPDDSKTTTKGRKASILKALKRQVLCQANMSVASVADVTAAASCLGKLKDARSSKKQSFSVNPPRQGLATLVTACGKASGDDSLSFVTINASPPTLSTISWCKSKTLSTSVASTVSPSSMKHRQPQEKELGSKCENEKSSPIVPTKVAGTSTSHLPLSASTPHAPTATKFKSRSTSSSSVAWSYSSETSPDDSVVFKKPKVPMKHRIQPASQRIRSSHAQDNRSPAPEIAAEASPALDVLWVNKIGRLTAEWLASFMVDKNMKSFQGRFDQGLNKNLLFGLCARCNIKAELSESDPTVFTLRKLRHSQPPTEHDLQQCIRQTRRI